MVPVLLVTMPFACPMRTPTLDAEPAPAVPVTEMFPPPVLADTVPPEILTPFEVVLLAPLVPVSAMELPVLFVLTDPPVIEIP